MGHFPSTRGLVLEVLFREPAISRAEISRATGLSRQTVGEIVADLERSNLVRRNGMQQGQVGRPATEHVVNPDAAFGVGVDLGGTNLRVALCDLTGQIRAQWRGSTPRSDLASLIDLIRETVDTLAEETGLLRDDWNAMAIGIPGVVHAETGFVRLAENLEYLNGVHLQSILENSLGVPVQVDNDVNYAAIGEWIGLDEDADNFAFLSVGTGIGLALVMDGSVRSGATGAAGEIGTMPFPGTGTRLEDRIGAPALERKLQAFVPGFTSVQEVLSGSPETWTSGVDEVVQELVNDLVQAVGVITAIADPEFIVVGGGIGSNPMIQERLITAIADQGLDLPPIKSSVWGDVAGAAGCAVESLLMLRHQLIQPDGSNNVTRSAHTLAGSHK